VPAVPVGPPGFLLVEATPWGTLLIDGKSHGPVEGSKRVQLPPGTHEVKLVNPPKKSKTWTVTIESGKTTKPYKYNFISE
jgi:hypothetical protein